MSTSNTNKLNTNTTSSTTTSTMTSQNTKQTTSYAPSTYSESTTYSYDNMKQGETSQSQEQKPKRSWRQRVKKSLKEVGYPPTYQYDLQHGKKRPEYGIFGESVFTDKRLGRT